MTIPEMRTKVADAYEGIRWKNRVYFMSDNQVVAIYHSIRNRNGFKKNKKKTRSNDIQPHQITIWEYLEECKGENK